MNNDGVLNIKKVKVTSCKKTNTVFPERNVNSKTPKLGKLQIIRETGKRKDISCHIVQDGSGFIVVLFEGG